MSEVSSSALNRQIKMLAALDVQAIERALNELWKEMAASALSSATVNRDEASAQEEEDAASDASLVYRDDRAAVLRTRVLNLLVYVASESELNELSEALDQLTAAHPCRALVMFALRDQADRDIETFITTHCQDSSAGAAKRRMCCERVTLRASGQFVAELPSAALPLVIPDLPKFLWWRAPYAPPFQASAFNHLASTVDRVIVDSTNFQDTLEDFIALSSFIKSEEAEETFVSDLNWARLLSWRALIASLFDAPERRAALERLSEVRIKYHVPEESDAPAPQALLLTSWLATRLNWRIAHADRFHFIFEKNERRVNVLLQPITLGAPCEANRIKEVTLIADETTSFTVKRDSERGRYETSVKDDPEGVAATLAISCLKRSEINLLARELETLSTDRVYEEAIACAAETCLRLASSSPAKDK
jgi:glucose-6-phosphate dehydrogenase assembly protein OpcA